MKKNCRSICAKAHPQKSSKPNISRRIYKMLDSAERIAIAISKINRTLQKIESIRDKRFVRINRADGMLVLKRQRRAKRLKRQKGFGTTTI